MTIFCYSKSAANPNKQSGKYKQKQEQELKTNPLPTGLHGSLVLDYFVFRLSLSSFFSLSVAHPVFQTIVITDNSA